jgi:hypothetical protein
MIMAAMSFYLASPESPRAIAHQSPAVAFAAKKDGH